MTECQKVLHGFGHNDFDSERDRPTHELATRHRFIRKLHANRALQISTVTHDWRRHEEPAYVVTLR